MHYIEKNGAFQLLTLKSVFRIKKKKKKCKQHKNYTFYIAAFRMYKTFLNQ